MDEVVNLPSSEEIMQRLTKVCDTEYLVRNLYPNLAKHGGEEKVAIGVVMMINLSIHDFLESGSYPDPVRKTIYMYVPAFIDALVDNHEVATQAKCDWQDIYD